MGRWILLCLLLFPCTQQLCDIKPPAETNLVNINLFSVGTPGQRNYSHVISGLSDVSSYGATYGITPKLEYILDASTLKQATSTCTSECLTELSALLFTDANTKDISITMSRPGDEVNYPKYQTTSFPKVYCTKLENTCGASIPLYLYYNSAITDYYVSTSDGGPSDGADPYPPATLPPAGTPLCYVWEPVLNMSTTTYSTTTTINTASTTPYTSSTKPFANATTTPKGSTTTTKAGSSTTTVKSNSSTTTTTAKPTTISYIIVTDAYGSTYTVPAPTPAGGSTTPPKSGSSTSSSKKFLDKWWKWVLISAGVTLCVGLVIAALGCLTRCFISPASTKSTPVSYSPPTTAEGQNVLPPQPVEAGPSPQPLTVGYPPADIATISPHAMY